MIWTREESKERFPEALSPLGWSVLQSALDVNLKSIRSEFYLKKLNKDYIARWIDGYLYSGKDFFRRIPLYNFSLPTLAGLFLKIFLHALSALFVFRGRETFKVRWVKRVYQKELKPKIQKTIYDWQSELPKHLKNFDDNTLAGLSWYATQPDFNILMAKIENDGCAYNRLDFAIYFYKNLLKSLLELLARWKNETISIPSLTAQSPFQISHHISQLIAEGSLLVDEQNTLAFVTQKIGHLSLSWDVAQPTFSEKSDLIKKMISERRESLLASRANQTFSDNEIAAQFIQLVSCDEQHRFYASYQFPTVRTLLYKIADEWVQRKILHDRNELFFLTLDEVISKHSDAIKGNALDSVAIQRIIKMRKSYLKPNASDELPDNAIEFRESIFYTSKALTSTELSLVKDELSGIVASPGQARGPAIWVTDYESLENCPQDCVLLCQTPSPNFHNAFVKSLAILSESGGLLSHGAIIARELQIPCLLQVVNLKTIKNGDLIEVDTTTGMIKRLS
ncbi:MAG: hypothetical protein JNM24_14335 [Bdellovibrionaceae bacterium]|nr:hypothetical protein [Pseudobdellovibrionaceae bacterium]